jgi:hypothetical protein
MSDLEHPWKDQAFAKLKKFQIQTLMQLIKDDQIKMESQSQPPATAYALYDDLLDTLEESLALIERKTQPTVFDRIDELDFMGDNGQLEGMEEYSYSWSAAKENPLAGSEKLDRKSFQGGGSHYSGVYHPDVVCETFDGGGGPGICKHCGRTLF